MEFNSPIDLLTESEFLMSTRGEQYHYEKQVDKKDNNNSPSIASLRSHDSFNIIKREPPLSWGVIFWSCAINVFLPFVNGLMLGFGEIFAHELGFRWGWSAARVCNLFVNNIFIYLICV